MLAASVVLALALAGPGLAADELVPLVEIPPPPDVATSAPSVAPPDPTQPPAPGSESSTPSATEPPITISVDTDGGDVDVSVRVLSPGEDAGEGVEPPVISGSDSPDITADPAPASDGSIAPTGDGTEGSNTNVTVRVLSPGDNGPVGQDDPLEAGVPGNAAPEAPTEVATAASALDLDVAEAPNGSAVPPKDGEQYQGSDSRYQSSAQFQEDAWIWLWYLALDCDGNPTSTSTETGRQSSREWRWEWTWEWACGSPPHPPPIDSLEPAIDSDATRVEPGSPMSTAPASGVASGNAVTPEPWLWTWTFTFCGERVSATLPISAETTLEWVWEWMWTWTCRTEAPPAPSGPMPDPAANDPAPAPVTGAAGQPGAGGVTPAVGPDVGLTIPWFVPVDVPAWVISLLPFAEPELGATIRVVPVLDPATRAGLLSTVSEVAPTQLPFGVPTSPVDIANSPPGLGTTVISPPGAPRREPPAATVPVPTDRPPSRRAEHRSSEPRFEKAPPRAKRHSAGRRSGDTPLTSWPPPLRPLQGAGAAGASSSFMPSTSVVGTAALVALFVLAAPGFGRRVRVARELRPRGTFGSSIDHPG